MIVVFLEICPNQQKHKQAALRVTCSKLYDFSCLRRFQFSEIEYAKYPSPFIFFSEAPVFIGIPSEKMKGEECSCVRLLLLTILCCAIPLPAILSVPYSP